jgi:hypothetical protein
VRYGEFQKGSGDFLNNTEGEATPTYGLDIDGDFVNGIAAGDFQYTFARSAG